MFSNYEVEYYGVDCTSTNDISPLSRIRNVLFKAFAKFNRLPKIMVVILEDDVLEALKCNDFGLAEAYQHMFEWLVREYYRGILTIKEILPQKAVRDHWPHVLFIAPSVHNSYANDNKRRKFTIAMEKVAREYKHFKNMSVRRLKQVWDPEDRNLYLNVTKSLSEEGYRSFWKAVDRTTKFCANGLEEQDMQYTADQYNNILEERQAQAHKPRYSSYTSQSKQEVSWKNDRYHYDVRNK